MAAKELIATVTLGSSAASIDFTSIPGTYTDLMVVFSGRSSSTGSSAFFPAQLKFNGSTANYTQRRMYGTNGATGSANDSYGVESPESNATANTFSNVIIRIPNYAGSTQKSVTIDNVSANSSALALWQIAGGLWTQTAAITSFGLVGYSSTNLLAGTTASLYGFNKGSDGVTTVA